MPVYVAARDLANVPFGKHQFVIIELSAGAKEFFKLGRNNLQFSRDLGNGKLGFVIGAQNRGRLKAEFFEYSDYLATREYYNPSQYVSWYKSDLDAELKEVAYSGGEAEFIEKVLLMINNYIINEQDDNIPYPFMALSYNSNSWA